MEHCLRRLDARSGHARHTVTERACTAQVETLEFGARREAEQMAKALIDLRVVSGIQDILRQIGEFQKGDRTGFTYRIKGRLHLAGGFGSIPFDTTGEFAFPTGAPKSGS